MSELNVWLRLGNIRPLHCMLISIHRLWFDHTKVEVGVSVGVPRSIKIDLISEYKDRRPHNCIDDATDR